jgi:hypothetical protein
MRNLSGTTYMKKSFAFALLGLMTLAVSACSPRYGLDANGQPSVPLRGPGDYAIDDRYMNPNDSYIPDTLAVRKLPHKTRSDERTAEWNKNTAAPALNSGN